VPGLSAPRALTFAPRSSSDSTRDRCPTIDGSHHHGIGTSDSWIAFDDALEGLEIAQPSVFLRSG